MTSSGKDISLRTGLIAALCAVVGLAALRASQDVSLPIVTAFLAATACFPLYRWLAPRISRAAAVLVSLMVVVTFVGLIGAGLAFSGQLIAEHASENGEQLKQSAEAFLSSIGTDTQTAIEQAKTWSQSAAKSFASGLTGLVLAIAIMSLFLFDSNYLLSWVGRRGEVLRSLGKGWRKLSRDLALFVMVRTGLGVLTGAFTWLACLALGVRLAAVWGFLNFLLNYIPTIGSILGVIPPTLFVLLNTGSVSEAAMVLAAVGGIQLVMGNWVDPLMQGKYLQIAPSVVLVAVTFWGWLWGPGGALVAVPLTMVMIRLCQTHEATRPFASLLAKSDLDPSDGQRSKADDEVEHADRRRSEPEPVS